METTTRLICRALLTAFWTGLLGQAQAVPQMINYQGCVIVAGTPVDGLAHFKFALVDGDGTTATASYWSNDGTSAVGNEPSAPVTLIVRGGLYSVLLGDAGMRPIPASVFVGRANVRLRVWFSQAAGGPYDLLGPDQRIAVVGFAMTAATALSVEEPVTPIANMVRIEPGSFAIGSPDDEKDRNENEGPQTAVTIRQGFWMGTHEVTQGEYQSLMGDNPSWFNGDRTSAGGANYGEDPSRPVDSVSWHDAMSYCAALTTRERNAGRIPSDWAYRLPTEAEWEYVARAGTATRYSHGDDLSYAETLKYAWCSANSGYQTHPVGQKRPNPWGLYDIYGNVIEWCADWYAWDYPGGSLIDPTGPTTGSFRVTRGGNWDTGAKRCRSARRMIFVPEDRSLLVGFRVVLVPGRL